MREEWTTVRVGDVVSQRRDAEKVTTGREYRLLGVRWYGEGAFLRETVTSETSKATTLYAVEPGQFIYNRLFAGKGSFGVVTPELTGSYVSNEFPLFDVASDRLSVAYLNLYFQQRDLWDYIEAVSVGTTASRNRWKESAFVEHQMPLPPLSVQERIVEVIGSIDANIAALDAEADAARAVYDGSRSLLWSDDDGGVEAPLRRLSDVMDLEVEKKVMESGTIYHQAGVLNSGNGLIDRGAFDGSTTEYSTMNVLREGQVVMRKLTAWEGPIAVVPPEFDGYVVSNEFPTFKLHKDVSPGWFSHVCRSERLRTQMRGRVTGTVQRRKRLSPDQLLQVELPVPSGATQTRAEALEALAVAAMREAARLRAVRLEVVANLLNRDIDFDNTRRSFR